MIDGGTRCMLDVDPGSFRQNPMLPDRVPDRMRTIFDRLRAPITAEEASDYRKEGGRTATLPLPPLDLGSSQSVCGTVELGNLRRLDNGTVEATTMTFYVEVVVFVRIGFESGQVSVQLKARALWAEGFEAIASRWLHAVLWWTTGRRCDASTAEAQGWRITGLELCSDYIGVEFNDPDLDQFVGFAKGELIRKIKRNGLLEYMAWGSRASRTSLAIYDKDEQIAAKSKNDGGTGGDDSCYRATHLAHGWDGKSKRVRVEFRFTGQGLRLKLPGGEVLDFRNPATLCDRGALRILWATICAKKRLVVGDRREAARHDAHRAVESIDPRWDLVRAAADMPFVFGARQTREAQTDAWTEAVKRARRDVNRSIERMASLHDVKGSDPSKVLEFVLRTTSENGSQHHRAYGENYRYKREEFIGDEIRALGRQAWMDAMGPGCGTFYPTAAEQLEGSMRDVEPHAAVRPTG